MKSTFIAGSTVILASVLFAGGPAYVQFTRGQVKTELAEAIRIGDVVGDPACWPVKGPLRQTAGTRHPALNLTEATFKEI